MKIKTMVGPAGFWTVLLAALLCLAVAASGWAAGGSAADFTLKNVTDGKDYSLSQFKGKVVLVNFFTFFCGPCREEMPHLNQIDQALKSQGFETLGIGLASTPEQLKQIVSQLGLKYPVLIGSDAVSKAYGGIELVPMTFIIDKQGNIAHKVLGARSKEDFEKMIKPLL
ncbi:MAG: TlpA family protein disulfide reductase [Syntrophobacterales bacterium]|jgi:peroxiredoxin|nr:TlpA family protein disulfide reductase [Syntrophobacterales bacterium]